MGNEHFRVPLCCNIFQFYLDKSDENIFDLKCLFMPVPVLYADAELLYSLIECRHQPRQPPCLYPDTRNTHYPIRFFLGLITCFIIKCTFVEKKEFQCRQICTKVRTMADYPRHMLSVYSSLCCNVQCAHNSISLSHKLNDPFLYNVYFFWPHCTSLHSILQAWAGCMRQQSGMQAQHCSWTVNYDFSDLRKTVNNR